MIINEVLCFLQNYSTLSKDSLKKALAACDANALTDAADDIFLQISKHDDALVEAYKGDTEKGDDDPAIEIAGYIVDKFVMANRKGVSLPTYVACTLDKVPKLSHGSGSAANNIKMSTKAQSALLDMSVLELESLPRQVDNIRKSISQLRADTDANSQTIDRMKIEISSHSSTLADFRGRLERCESSAVFNNHSTLTETLSSSIYSYAASDTGSGSGSRFRSRNAYKNPEKQSEYEGQENKDKEDVRRPQSALGFLQAGESNGSSYGTSRYNSFRPRAPSASGTYVPPSTESSGYQSYQPRTRSRYESDYKTYSTQSGISLRASGGHRSRKHSWSSAR